VLGTRRVLEAAGQPPRPHGILGEATHPGRHDGEGTIRADSADFDLGHGLITGRSGGGSPFVFVGPDGGRLVTWSGRTDHGASGPGPFVLTILGTTPGAD
jgi:hypothetical protein